MNIKLIGHKCNLSYECITKVPKSPSRFIEFDENNVLWGKLYGWTDVKKTINIPNCYIESMKSNNDYLIGIEYTIKYKGVLYV